MKQNFYPRYSSYFLYHWDPLALKVILIVACYAIESSCRPYSKLLYPRQKGPYSFRNNNRTQELRKEVRGILNGILREPRLPRQISGKEYGGILANNIGHYNKNEMKRRGLDVGILVNLPTTKQYDSDLKELGDMLANILEGRPVMEKFNTSNCPSCEEEEIVIKRTLKPAYECDEWNSKLRVCILERNIGDTVTFYLSTGREEGIHQPNVTWKKEFHIRSSEEKQEFVIDPQKPPESIIIGKRGFELRISPVTETDVANNMFSASLEKQTSVKSKLYFMIRIVPVDLGFVYVGETIELNLRKFVSLPIQSMTYKWYMEKDGEHGTLPSNMKVSVTGSSIKIYELRQEQEGILACSVYTNLNILATKKRFLIKDLPKNKDVLQSSPNDTLFFKEEFRKKRDRKRFLPFLSSLIHSRPKRERLAVEEVERALLQPITTEMEIPNYTTSPPRYNDYNPYIQMQHEEPRTFEENGNRFQEISDDTEDFGSRLVDTPINREPVAVEEPVEGQRIPLRSQPINEELSLPTGVPVDDLNALDTRPLLNQPRNELIKKPYQYPVNKIPLENAPVKLQGGPVLDISVNRPPPSNTQLQQNTPQSANSRHHPNGEQYIDLDIQSKGRMPNQQDGYSDVVINIDGIRGLHKITPEDTIAKLISYCFSDAECSVTATCVRTSLKQPGFCKCLPGSNGEGIFCREEVWLSNGNFGLDEHNSRYVPYLDTLASE